MTYLPDVATISSRLTAKELSVRFPAPGNALACDSWASVSHDGVPLRYVLWIEKQVGALLVTVAGFQSGHDGSFETSIVATVEHGSADFTANEARAAAAALLEAAEALENIR